MDLRRLNAQDLTIANALLEKFACSLCQDVLIDATLTNCGHHFCKHCLAKHLMTDRQCPNCSDIVEKTIPLDKVDVLIDNEFQKGSPELVLQRQQKYYKLRGRSLGMESSHSDGCNKIDDYKIKSMNGFTEGERMAKTSSSSTDYVAQPHIRIGGDNSYVQTKMSQKVQHTINNDLNRNTVELEKKLLSTYDRMLAVIRPRTIEQASRYNDFALGTGDADSERTRMQNVAQRAAQTADKVIQQENAHGHELWEEAQKLVEIDKFLKKFSLDEIEKVFNPQDIMASSQEEDERRYSEMMTMMNTYPSLKPDKSSKSPVTANAIHCNDDGTFKRRKGQKDVATVNESIMEIASRSEMMPLEDSKSESTCGRALSTPKPGESYAFTAESYLCDDFEQQIRKCKEAFMILKHRANAFTVDKKLSKFQGTELKSRGQRMPPLTCTGNDKLPSLSNAAMLNTCGGTKSALRMTGNVQGIQRDLKYSRHRQNDTSTNVQRPTRPISTAPKRIQSKKPSNSQL